jgi:osmotically-inducible protein OsmY
MTLAPIAFWVGSERGMTAIAVPQGSKEREHAIQSPVDRQCSLRARARCRRHTGYAGWRDRNGRLDYHGGENGVSDGAGPTCATRARRYSEWASDTVWNRGFRGSEELVGKHCEENRRRARGTQPPAGHSLQVVPKADQAVVAKSDAELKNAIKNRLQDHRELVAHDIDVAVKNGVARLTGKVKTQGDRLIALTVARTTTGVHVLIDDLRLEPGEVSSR